MGNLEIYEKYRNPPKEALKGIGGGRLKGMTDINPMWRIKALTEAFGLCGIGWYYTTDKQWIEPYEKQAVAFVNISLYVKVGNKWSKPIFGTGGSMLAALESKGVFVSDECFKMATTDAISVACKQLGFGADIYWDKDKTKYSVAEESAKTQGQIKENEKPQIETISDEMYLELQALCKQADRTEDYIAKSMGITDLKALPTSKYAIAKVGLQKIINMPK